MKKLTFIFLLLSFIVVYNSISYSQEDTTKWKFFKLLVTVSDDSIFTKLQDDVGITPYLTSYTLNVDIRSDDPEKQFIVFGLYYEPTSDKFGWMKLREEVRNGLLNWKKPNKMRLEEK